MKDIEHNKPVNSVVVVNVVFIVDGKIVVVISVSTAVIAVFVVTVVVVEVVVEARGKLRTCGSQAKFSDGDKNTSVKELGRGRVSKQLICRYNTRKSKPENNLSN